MTNVLTSEPPGDRAASPTFDQERGRIHRQMLSSVSHDLKTPLASIIGSLEVYVRMKDALSVEKQDTLIKVALQEAYRLDAFITNILDMGKLESGLVKPKQEDVDIGSMLRDCLTRMKPRMEDSTASVEAPSGDIRTMTDAVLLSRVICLVIDNAVKYGGTPPMLRIRYGTTDNQMGYIAVHDNGKGIPENQTESVFCKYTRFGREDQRNAGTGLGLSIAREIMRLLEGDLMTVNHADGGAIFTLRFPLRAPNQ